MGRISRTQRGPLSPQFLFSSQPVLIPLSSQTAFPCSSREDTDLGTTYSWSSLYAGWIKAGGRRAGGRQRKHKSQEGNGGQKTNLCHKFQNHFPCPGGGEGLQLCHRLPGPQSPLPSTLKDTRTAFFLTYPLRWHRRQCEILVWCYEQMINNKGNLKITSSFLYLPYTQSYQTH